MSSPLEIPTSVFAPSGSPSWSHLSKHMEEGRGESVPVIPRSLMQKLPKAELHCHLDGSLRISTLLELAKEQGVEDRFPTVDPAELAAIIQVDETCESLVSYLRGFSICNIVLQTKYALTRAVFETAEDANADGVRYIEIRFSPVLHTNRNLSLTQVMEAVCEGQALAEYKLPIKVRIIVCGMRQNSPEEVETLAEIAWRYATKGVVAFDLAGPEDGFSSEIHKAAFDIVRAKHLNCTLHSGEAAGWQYVVDAIRHCGAQRLGHGVAIRENADLEQFVIDRRLAVEVCLTSNAHTRAVSDLGSHPLRRFFDNGMVVALCTDNPTISNICLTDEYMLAQREFGFTPSEMLRLIDNGFRAAFLPPYLKSRLRVEALRECAQLFSSAGIEWGGSSRPIPQAHLAPSLAWPLKPSLFSREQSAHSRQVECGVLRNPHLTRQLLRRMPKTDLHCAFEGSVSLQFVHRQLKRMMESPLPDDDDDDDDDDDGHGAHHRFPTSLEELRAIVQPHQHDASTRSAAKALMVMALQTREQLRAGMEDIFSTCIADAVMYAEVMVRPCLHTRQGLSVPQVVECLLDACNRGNAKHKGQCTIGIVLYADSSEDEEERVEQTARLAVEHRRNGVCGFGIFGADVDDVVVDSVYEFCPMQLDYLKKESMNICIAAGRTGSHTITTAVHDGGANRISGAFSIHRDPALMGYFALHAIPIELGLTDLYAKHTKEMRRFAKNPIECFLDNDLVVTMCTFDRTLYSKSLSDVYMQLAEEMDLTIMKLIKIISFGIQRSFQPYRVRQELFESFRRRTLPILDEMGFHCIAEPRYFV